MGFFRLPEKFQNHIQKGAPSDLSMLTPTPLDPGAWRLACIQVYSNYQVFT